MIERFLKFNANVALAHKLITKIKSHKMNKFNLKAANVMCLFFLGKNPQGLTPGQLCKLCQEDKAGISKSLSILKEKKYVTAESDDKKYRAIYKITDEGQTVFDEISDYIIEVVEKAGVGLSESERLVFYVSLENIVDNLKKICDEIETSLN